MKRFLFLILCLAACNSSEPSAKPMVNSTNAYEPSKQYIPQKPNKDDCFIVENHVVSINGKTKNVEFLLSCNDKQYLIRDDIESNLLDEVTDNSGQIEDLNVIAKENVIMEY